MERIFSYLENVPPIPEELLTTREELLATTPLLEMYSDASNPIKWEYKESCNDPQLAFVLYTLPKEIFDWAEENLPWPLEPVVDPVLQPGGWYMLVYNNMVIHRDISRDMDYRVCLNYMVHQGGDNVNTIVYHDDGVEIEQEIIIKNNSWTKVPMERLHTVNNVTDEPRMFVRFFLRKDIKWEDVY